MTLKDEIEAQRQQPGSLGSKIDRIFEQLSEDEAAELREALLDPSIAATAITRALKARNFDLGKSLVGQWRRDHSVSH